MEDYFADIDLGDIFGYSDTGDTGDLFDSGDSGSSVFGDLSWDDVFGGDSGDYNLSDEYTSLNNYQGIGDELWKSEEPEGSLLDDIGGYYKNVEKLMKDNPMASKAISSLLAGYFSKEQAEDDAKLRYKLESDLAKLKASLSSSGSSGPPAATTATPKSPGRIVRK